MSSPTTARSQTVPTRNPRRRQRNDAEEPLSLRAQPQRKRSKVDEDFFEHASGAAANGHAQDAVASEAVEINGKATSFAKLMPSRSRPHPSRRSGGQNDGTSLLTSNDNYSIRQLPALPAQLRNRPPYAGFLEHTTNLAVAFTQQTAYVWDPSSTSPSPNIKTFTLPPLFHTDKLLPLGALVPSGNSSDYSLVVIAPSTGKIAFWESIEHADALSLFQQRRNVLEGSVGGLFSGETIIGLEHAGLAGFVLLFSSGRAAHLTLVDPQSRPSINVTFLRNNSSSANSGFFGGLKNALGVGGYLSSVAAAKTRISTSRLQADTIVASAEGVFQSWKLTWSGQSTFQWEHDVRPNILEAVKAEFAQEPSLGIKEGAVQLVDMALDIGVSDSQALVASDVSLPQTYDMFALVRTGSEYLQHLLLKLTVAADRCTVHWTRRLDLWATSMAMNTAWRPKLIIPRNSQTAFIVFDRGLALLSIASRPSHQVSGLPTAGKPFQDAISLRVEPDYYVVGAGENTAPSHRGEYTVSLFLRSHGVISVTVSEKKSDQNELYHRSRLSAKVDMEQAIFYGTMPDNPIDLGNRSKADFKLEEVADAATKISEEIVTDTSSFLSNIPGTMEHQLEVRFEAIQNLAKHIKHAYPPLPDISTRWALRTNAEKMAAGLDIWRDYDGKCAHEPGHRRLLPHLLDFLHERYKTATDESTGDVDPIRWYFTKDVYRVEHLMPWAYQAVFELVENERLETKDGREGIVAMLGDASALMIAGISSALQYRQESGWLYNIEDEAQDSSENGENGIPIGKYRGIPELWTSSQILVDNLRELVDIGRSFVKDTVDAYLIPSDPYHSGGDWQKLVELIPDLVQLACEVHIERIAWLLSQHDEGYMREGEALRRHFKRLQTNMISGLADIGQMDAGIKLARHFFDMQALVQLTIEKSARIARDDAGYSGQKRAEESSIDLEKQIKLYMNTYGSPFAEAFFSAQVRRRHLRKMMDLSAVYKDELTSYLRASPKRIRLRWINDVLSEGNYLQAGDELMSLATRYEDNHWSRRIELSLAKLAIVASNEEGDKAGEVQKRERRWRQAHHLSKVQDHLTHRIHPSLYESLDDDGAADNVKMDFGSVETRGRPHLQKLLHQSFEKLVEGTALNAEELIDILTLIDAQNIKIKDDISWREDFARAFEVLRWSDMEKSSKLRSVVGKIIWRRLLIRDPWQAINQTTGKSDAEVDDMLRHTTLFTTLLNLARNTVKSSNNTSTTQNGNGNGNDNGNGNGIESTDFLTNGVPDPEEVLDSGTNAEDLAERFSDPSVRERLAADMMLEKKKLAAQLKQYRLKHWMNSVVELVKREVRFGEAQGRTRADQIAATLASRGINVDDLPVGSSINGHGYGRFGSDEE